MTWGYHYFWKHPYKIDIWDDKTYLMDFRVARLFPFVRGRKQSKTRWFMDQPAFRTLSWIGDLRLMVMNGQVMRWEWPETSSWWFDRFFWVGRCVRGGCVEIFKKGRCFGEGFLNCFVIFVKSTINTSESEKNDLFGRRNMFVILSNHWTVANLRETSTIHVGKYTIVPWILWGTPWEN